MVFPFQPPVPEDWFRLRLIPLGTWSFWSGRGRSIQFHVIRSPALTVLTSRWLFRWSWDDTIGLLVMLLAWSGAFVTFTWSPDNHQQMLELGQCTTLWAQLGRPLMDLLYCHLFRGFQPQLHLLLGLLCLWTIGRLLTSLWRLERGESLLLVAWITTFPFLVNVFGFETGKFSIPLAYLLTTLSWVLVSRCSGLRFWCAPLLLAASLALYQTSLNLLVVIAMLSLVFSGESPVSTGHFRAQVVPTVVRLTLLAAPGVMLYAVTAEAARWYLRAGYNPRYAVMGGPETPLGLVHQLKDIAGHYKHLLLPGHALLPPVTGVCVAVAALVVLSYRSWPQLVALAAAAVGVWTTDLPVTGSLLGTGYRHIYPVVLIFAALCILALRRSRPHRRLVLALAGLYAGTIAAFILVDNAWAFDTHRLAVFDTAVAQRLAQSIEASPYHSPRQPLLITGALRASARPPGLQPRGFDVLGSALDNPGAARALLRSLGVRFADPASAAPGRCEALRAAARPVIAAPGCTVVDLSQL